jgi:hypothetical protein
MALKTCAAHAAPAISESTRCSRRSFLHGCATLGDTMKTLYKSFSTDISVTDGERAVSAVISTIAVDRDGETLLALGCNYKDYSANAVVFYNHSYADWSASPQDKLPVGKCVGLAKDKDEIRFKMVFAERPANHPSGEEWLPDTLFALYQQGIMRAFSVGFIPVEIRAATDKDLLTFGADCRRVVSKWNLLEVSAVPLPANQEAVAMAVSKRLITRDQVKSIFGEKAAESDDVIAAEKEAAAITAPPVEKAADEPKMGTCTKCDKEFSVDDLEDVDGDLMCVDCKAAAKSATTPESTVESPAAGEPLKHVVRSIESDDEPATTIKRVHRVIETEKPARLPVKKYVINEIHKRRGRIYH